jgi:hypothetical protein
MMPRYDRYDDRYDDDDESKYDDDEDERERVRAKIGEAVFSFCRAHEGQAFHMEDLVRCVRHMAPFVAPDSPSRALRLLRQEGLVNYEVVSRSDSLYRVLNVLIPTGGCTRVEWGVNEEEEEREDE